MSVKAEAKPLAGPLPGGGSKGVSVVVEPLLAGEVFSPPAAFESTGGRLAMLRAAGLGTPRSKWWRAPVPAFLITHPVAGPLLVDTGFHPSVAAKPSANLGRIATQALHPRLEPGADLSAQLRSRDLDPRKIGLVVMTHLHVDHASGISEFPNATFVLSEAEWTDATTGSRPIVRGYRPSHYDYLFDYRTIDFERGEGIEIDSYATFGRSFDLFGDGSLRLVYTPGHSAGHCAVIARLRERDFVIAGDAIYTLAQLDKAPPPPRPFDMHNWNRSLRDLQNFQRTYPQAVIVPGHDPAAWAALEQRYE